MNRWTNGFYYIQSKLLCQKFTRHQLQFAIWQYCRVAKLHLSINHFPLLYYYTLLLQ